MKIFSLPLSPKLNEQEFQGFLDFCNKYKEYIFDIYFTSRIPPFTQDAMGDVFTSIEDQIYLIKLALHVQNVTGITVSATFNNINVPPTQELLDLFIEQFRPLYDAGVRSATIPHTHWVATKQIQTNFPELFIKNTILRNVSRPNEIVELAKAGFNYINIDRDLMRDSDTLKELKKAKDYCHEIGFNIHLSLLGNEGCQGNCPYMDEHYCFNLSRNISSQYFNNSISRVSCFKSAKLEDGIEFKIANIPPWKEDWEEFREKYGIDVFKLHGRENTLRLFESMRIVERYANDEVYMSDAFEVFVKDKTMDKIDVWRTRIKNCKFNCWDCGYCSTLNTMEPPEKIILTLNAIDESVLSFYKNDIQGLTSQRVKSLLNILGKGSKRYLEIGTHNGATFYSVVDGNTIEANACDIWKDDVQPLDSILKVEKNSFDTFNENINKIDSSKASIRIHKKPMMELDTKELKDIDLFFYDGDHSYKDTYNSIKKFYPCFANETILVFDDANWDGVVTAVSDALNTLPVDIVFEKLILNDQESPTQWWNGLYIIVLNKQ
jgi:hypothetical protein